MDLLGLLSMQGQLWQDTEYPDCFSLASAQDVPFPLILLDNKQAM